jgi:hypothetical protein
MLKGSSSPSSPPGSYSPDGGALKLTLNKNAAVSSGPAGVLQSKTLYVVNSSLFKLKHNEKLKAEVVFDHPMGDTTGVVLPKPYLPTDPTPYNPKDFAWAVGIAMKGGNDANETPNQKMIKAACQFFSGGNVHFSFANYRREPWNNDALFDQTLVSTLSYADYVHPLPGTEFRLSIEISRWASGAADPSLNGTATLQVGASTYTGGALEDLTGVEDIDWAGAVGFSLVSAHNNMKSIQARVKYFSMEITPYVPWKRWLTTYSSRQQHIPVAELTTYEG